VREESENGELDLISNKIGCKRTSDVLEKSGPVEHSGNKGSGGTFIPSDPTRGVCPGASLSGGSPESTPLLRGCPCSALPFEPLLVTNDGPLGETRWRKNFLALRKKERKPDFFKFAIVLVLKANTFAYINKLKL
jgi:hypothetical protein